MSLVVHFFGTQCRRWSH